MLRAMGYIFAVILITFGCTEEPDAPRVRTPVDTGNNLQYGDEVPLQDPFKPSSKAKSLGGYKRADGPEKYVVEEKEYGIGSDQFGDALKLKGLFFTPSSKARSDAIILAVHGRQGLSTDFKRFLLPYVAANFRVFALDMYGKVPASPEEEAHFADILRQRGDAHALSNISQAQDYLVQNLGARSVFILGENSGGYWALVAVITHGGRYKALVNFNGDALALEDYSIRQIVTPMIHLFPERGGAITQLQAATLTKQFQESEYKILFRIYSGVEAGFVSPASPKFAPQKASQAIEETIKFLENNL